MAKKTEQLELEPAANKWTPTVEAEIKKLLAALHTSEGDVTITGENHKCAKAARDAAQSRLNCYMDDLVSPQQILPFAAPEPWRDVTTQDLGLTPAIVEKLANHQPSIRTRGDIADWTADEHHRLTDVKGIGQAAAEAIMDACDKWDDDHPQAVAESEGDDTAAEEATNDD